MSIEVELCGIPTRLANCILFLLFRAIAMKDLLFEEIFSPLEPKKRCQCVKMMPPIVDFSKNILVATDQLRAA